MWTTFSDHQLSLEPNQVHIWSASITNHENRLPVYWSFLTNEEKEKAQKFKFLKDKNCFVIAKGILRKLLASYLSLSPKEINLKLGEYGKPFLHHSSNLQFNISHSRSEILLGFIQTLPIGIDIEYTKREIDVKNIAKHFFAEEEIEALLKLDTKYQTQAFYSCWTRKEAFIKALGSGLSFPLAEFVVSLDSLKKAKLIATKWDKKEKEKWILQPIEPRENYIGAFAVKGNVSKIQSWKYL